MLLLYGIWTYSAYFENKKEVTTNRFEGSFKLVIQVGITKTTKIYKNLH